MRGKRSNNSILVFNSLVRRKSCTCDSYCMKEESWPDRPGVNESTHIKVITGHMNKHGPLEEGVCPLRLYTTIRGLRISEGTTRRQ